MVETFKAAHEHQGVSFIEIFQNCVIFNDATWNPVYSKENRDNQLLKLEAGQPLVFGKEKEKGLRMNGLTPEVVNVADVDESEILVHDPNHPSQLYAQMLADLNFPDYPTPIGVIRDIPRPTYESQIQEQVDDAIAQKGEGGWDELLKGKSTWTVKADS